MEEPPPRSQVDIDGCSSRPLPAAKRVKAGDRALRQLADHNGKGQGELSPLPVRRRQVTLGPEQTSLLLPDTGLPKVWILLDNGTHRLFRALLGRNYAYKQHVPTPAWLRRHRYPFTTVIQQEGELVLTTGASHYVVSGPSRGFSWSHADPATLDRLFESGARFGSRQADGKPNSFSVHYARAPDIMDSIRANLAAAPAWGQTHAQVAAHVVATATDGVYRATRLREGWFNAEVLPLFLPTEAQFADPFWLAAMMTSFGARHGSIHLRLPSCLVSDPARNFGQVCWPVETPMYRFLSTRVNIKGHGSVVNMKILRPEGKGFVGVAEAARILVPTDPKRLSALIDGLPDMDAPLYYTPQFATTAAQNKDLAAVLPAHILPQGALDGLCTVFTHDAPGTTTATAFGGPFGVTGLHEEYNHTVSVFLYPRSSPSTTLNSTGAAVAVLCKL